MNSLNPNHQEAIIKLICGRVTDPIAIYLFGSVAADAVHESSDIDIAVLPQEPLSTETDGISSKSWRSRCGPTSTSSICSPLQP